MLAAFYSNPAFVAVVSALPAAALGWLGYKRAMRVDRVAEQAGIATFQQGTVGQVIDGLNLIAENLREDNKELRERVEHVDIRLIKLSDDFVVCQKTLARLERWMAYSGVAPKEE